MNGVHVEFADFSKNGGFLWRKARKNFQFSVFRGDITPSKLIQLESDLKKVIHAEEDFVCIIKLMNDNVFGEDILGKRDRTTGEDLII